MILLHFPRYLRGFTLLEAMITVAVLAILVSVGVPSFRATVERNRVTTTANDLLYHLQLARSEAVKRNRTITLCPSSDGSACSGSNWSIGWLIIDEASPTLPIRIAQVSNGLTVTPSLTTTQIKFSAVGTVDTALHFTVTINTETRFVCLRISGATEVLLSGSSC